MKKKMARAGPERTAGAIRTVLVDDAQRRQLTSGALVIARVGDGDELIA